MSNELALSCSPQNMEQLWKFAQTAAKTGLIPQSFRNKPEDCYIAIHMGLELGLKPLQALSGIAVVNGKPCLYGDSLIALVRAFPHCEYVVEEFNTETMTAICKAKRKDQPEQVTEFSQEDAKTAKLWGKQGPWTQYPKRMLQMRARGFCLRDTFPDALMGLITMEEAQDYPTKDVVAKDVTPEAKPQPTEKPKFDLEAAKAATMDKLHEGGFDVPVDLIEAATTKEELTQIWKNKKVADDEILDADLKKSDDSETATDSDRSKFWSDVEEEKLIDYIPEETRELVKSMSVSELLDLLESARENKALENQE